MDHEGIPQKMYRHILSAVSYFNSKLNKGETSLEKFPLKIIHKEPFTGANFDGIVLIVRYFNLKLKPVSDIEIVIELCLFKLKGLGLVVQNNNLYYLDGSTSSRKQPRPFDIDNEGEIPLNPESHISTGTTLDMFKRIKLEFDGWKVPLEKAINYEY